MDVWEFLRIFSLYAGGFMMAVGGILFGTGLKKDDWKQSAKGLFMCMMGIFCIVMAIIAHITGK
jgi:hypothetical protein